MCPRAPKSAPSASGVTGLCILAFMSHGHVPGEGRYGETLARAADYVASCQKENGLLAVVAPDGPVIDRNVPHVLGVTAVYNHGIGSLVISHPFLSRPSITELSRSRARLPSSRAIISPFVIIRIVGTVLLV